MKNLEFESPGLLVQFQVGVVADREPLGQPTPADAPLRRLAPMDLS